MFEHSMKRTTRYVLKGVNESYRGLNTMGAARHRDRRNSVNESLGTLDALRTRRSKAVKPLCEAVKADTIVTEENIESVIRKVKKLTGCKVCMKGENLVACDTERVIIRKVLNGKRTVDGVIEYVKTYLDRIDAGECRREIKESVAERFAAYRHLYESEDEEEKEEPVKEDPADEKPEEPADEPAEPKEDDKKDSEDEDIPMTAVVLTVKHDDGVKLKDELVEAGIPEDDIDVIEGEDDEDDKVKVDANSIIELKDFLKEKKDIDLEEKLGGEIIDDEDEDHEDAEDKKKDGESEEKDDDTLDFGEADFDALFGADDDSADEK